MERRDISNLMGPHVAVDFEALLLYADTVRHQVWLSRLEKFPKIARKLQPMTIRWTRASHDAEVFLWYLFSLGWNITIIVRRKYTGPFLWYGNLMHAIHATLENFPCDRFHLIQHNSMQDQAKAINSFCRTHRVLRFFTSEPEVAKNLPESLVKFVTSWSEETLS